MLVDIAYSGVHSVHFEYLQNCIAHCDHNIFSFRILVVLFIFPFLCRFPFPSDESIFFYAICSFFLKYILGQNQLFSLQLFSVILSWVPFFKMSIVLCFLVWHQDHVMLMLDHCWGYHCLIAVHTAMQSVLNVCWGYLGTAAECGTKGAKGNLGPWRLVQK